MNHFFIELVAFSSLFLLSSFSPYMQTGKLTVIVNNVKTASGEVRVALYNSQETFLDPKKYVAIRAVPVGEHKSVAVEFPDLAYGQYAVTTYHDVNSNRKLDVNPLGIPDEPYDMTHLKVKWRKPTFKEVQFSFQEPKTVHLHLKRWIDR